MIIGVDGNEANVQKKVGVSVYTLKLLEEFKKNANKKVSFIIFLKKRPLSFMPSPTKYFRYKVIRFPFLWLNFLSIYLLYFQFFSKNKIDVFFSPAHYSPYILNSKLIVTIHDLSYIYFPKEFLKKDLYKLNKWTKDSIKRATKVIAVSKNTKRDIIKQLKIPSSKIDVIYNGFEKIGRAKKPDIPILPQNYFLYVGTLQPRKNIVFLVNAFSAFVKKFPDIKLVIVGKKGWLYNKILKLAQKTKTSKNIIFTDYIEDSKLIYLYKNSIALILPSLYEGFGIPILEAMSYKCPTILSYASSLPEIGGDASLYFNPQNPEELVEKMILIKSDKELRNKLIDKGLKRVKLFSWKKTAQKTLKLIVNSANEQ